MSAADGRYNNDLLLFGLLVQADNKVYMNQIV